MIINVRGTSGSGKSTLVRAIMANYGQRNPLFQSGRKQPLGYVLTRSATQQLFVPGHYETECGGCDTLSDDAMNTIYSLAEQYHQLGMDVLFEGLLVSAEARRMIELHARAQVTVINLTTPLDACLAGIQDRRARRGASAVLGPNTMKNLQSKQKGAATCCKRFIAAGIPVFELDRTEALGKVRELLRC